MSVVTSTDPSPDLVFLHLQTKHLWKVVMEKITETRTKRLASALQKQKEPEQQAEWNCPKCTFANHALLSSCEMCHSLKPLDMLIAHAEDDLKEEKKLTESEDPSAVHEREASDSFLAWLVSDGDFQEFDRARAAKSTVSTPSVTPAPAPTAAPPIATAVDVAAAVEPEEDVPAPPVSPDVTAMVVETLDVNDFDLAPGGRQLGAGRLTSYSIFDAPDIDLDDEADPSNLDDSVLTSDSDEDDMHVKAQALWN